MKYWFLFSFLCMAFALSSCKKEGCTDAFASNYDANANEDDGSCEYRGCTDPDAVNYNPNARTDNGSCRYTGDAYFFSDRSNLNQWNVFVDVFVNNQYIGKIQNRCTVPSPDCDSDCDNVISLNMSSGVHNVQFWEIIQTGSSSFDTLYTSDLQNFQVVGRECRGVLLQN